MIELARLHGEVGWRVHAFPVSVDGIEVVASLVLAHRRAGMPARWLPWAALAAGRRPASPRTSRSGRPIRLGDSWPAGRPLRYWSRSSCCPGCSTRVRPFPLIPRSGADGIDRDHRRAHGPTAATFPVGQEAGPSGPGPDGIDQDQPAAKGRAPAVPSELQAGPNSPGPERSTWTSSRRPDEARGGPPELQHAARRVRDELIAAGATVTRRSLATGLRAAGHRVRNDRLGPLLAAIAQPPQKTEVARMVDRRRSFLSPAAMAFAVCSPPERQGRHALHRRSPPFSRDTADRRLTLTVSPQARPTGQDSDSGMPTADRSFTARLRASGGPSHGLLVLLDQQSPSPTGRGAAGDRDRRGGRAPVRDVRRPRRRHHRTLAVPGRAGRGRGHRGHRVADRPGRLAGMGTPR